MKGWSKLIIEVIVKNEEEALKAKQYGAQRLELVSALSEGGLTPSYGAIKRTVETANIPVMVMIRPHSRGYVYSQADVNIIKEDIKAAKQLGAAGIVFGCLRENYAIDEKLLEEVLREAEGMEFTFHRAFDRVSDQRAAYLTLCQYGNAVTRILTSGGKELATDAKPQIKELVDLSREKQGPIIMPGSGMTPDNLAEMAEATGAVEFHYGIAFRDQYLFKQQGESSEKKYSYQNFY